MAESSSPDKFSSFTVSACKFFARSKSAISTGRFSSILNFKSEQLFLLQGLRHIEWTHKYALLLRTDNFLEY